MQKAALKTLFSFDLISDYATLRTGYLFTDPKKAALVYRRGGKSYFSINGEEFGGHDFIRDIRFNADGSKYWVVYCENALFDKTGEVIRGSWYVKIGGKVFGEYDEVSVPDVSPDFDKFCFHYVKGKYNDEEGIPLPPKWQVNIDGKDSPAYDRVTVSEDDNAYDKCIYVYNIGGAVDERDSIQGGKWYVRFGDDVLGGYDVIHHYSLNDNGICIVYVNNPVYEEDDYDIIIAGGSWGMYLDGTTYGPYPDMSTPVFGRDGQSFGFAYFNGTKWKFVINGTEYGDYDGAGMIVFSPDGSKFAYTYNIGYSEEDGEPGEWFAHVNDTEIGGYDEIFDIAFSRDGSETIIGYFHDGSWRVSFQGETYEAGEALNHIEVSPDGRKFAFSYIERGWYYLNINGKLHGGFSSISALPVFYNQDGGHRFIYSFDHNYANINIDDFELIALRRIRNFYSSLDGKIQVICYGDDTNTTLNINREELGVFREVLLFPGRNDTVHLVLIDNKRQVSICGIELADSDTPAMEEPSS